MKSIHLRQSFGEVKLSSSSRVTLKTGGLSGGLSLLSPGKGMNQMSQEYTSSLLGVMEDTVEPPRIEPFSAENHAILD